jgi:hypothetical protein
VHDIQPLTKTATLLISPSSVQKPYLHMDPSHDIAAYFSSAIVSGYITPTILSSNRQPDLLSLLVSNTVRMKTKI